MADKQLAVSEPERRIAPWGSRDDLREIAKRIQIMAPGAKKLDEGQALALAQGAVAHGLDPFNGEIWYIPGSGLMAGIKGLRKAARNQIEGNFWTEFEKLTNADERQLLCIPEGALAFRCIIRDTETIRAYSEMWADLRKNEVPVELIPQLIGRRPYVEGIGYVKRGEPTKMDPVQVAMKRAEADALKRRFDLPFAVPSEPNDTVTIDAEWVTQDESGEALHEKAAAASEALFGEDPSKPVSAPKESPVPPRPDAPASKPKRPYPPDILKMGLTDKTLHHEGENTSTEQRGLMVAGMELCLVGVPDPAKARHSILKFLFGVTSSLALTGPQVLAILDLLKLKKDSGGAYKPDSMAEKELRLVLHEALIEAGQEELPI